MAPVTPVQRVIPWRVRSAGRLAVLAVGAGVLIPAAAPCAQEAAPAPAGEPALAVEAAPAAATASVAGRFLAGRHAQDQRDLGAAAAFLLQALESDPDNLDLISRSFQVLQQQGINAKAEPLARRLVESGNANMLPRLFLATRRAAEQDYGAALAVLADTPNTRLHAIVGPLVEAWLTLGADGPDAATARLADLAQTPLASIAPLHAAMMADVAGRSDAAGDGYFATLETRDPPPLRLAQLYGNFLQRTGQPRRASAVYNQFLAAHPDSEPGRAMAADLKAGNDPVNLMPDARAGLAEALFDVASVFQRDRAHDTALMFVRMALTAKPDMTIAKVLLGEIYEHQQRHADAVAAYRGIGDNAMFGWTAKLRIADLLDDLDKTGEALDVLDAMAVQQPMRWDPLRRKGDILRGRERFEEAVAAYDIAVGRVPEIQHRHWGLLYARGISLERSQQWDRAEADFLKALELEPEQPYVLNYLGYSWIDKDRNLEEAMDMIRRAVEQRPNDGYIVDSLGWAHYKLGEYDQAVIALEKATAIRPHDPTINDHLGDAYWKVGRTAEARFQWERSLKLDPDDTLRTAIEAKIEHGLVEAPSAPDEKDG